MLNHHVKTVHVDNNEICEVCGKNFKHKRNLREHFRKQHKAKDPSKGPRIQVLTLTSLRKLIKWFIFKYTVCDMCGKKYRRKMDMLQHKKDDHLFITKEEVAALERLKETVRPNYFSIV